MRHRLTAHYGLADMDALIEAVRLGDLSPSRCVEMPPLLFEVADSGDAVATDVVRRQAGEEVAFAVAALRRLEMLGAPTPGVLGGGVLTAGHTLLLDTIDALLAEQAPYASTRVVQVP